MISSVPGLPTRQCDVKDNTQHSLTHSNEKGGHEKNDYDGKMIFGDLVGLKLPDICLIGEEIPHPGNLSRPGFEPGPAA